MKIIFLGTGGGRYVVFKQVRSTGGLWIQIGDKNILIDPGPASLLRILKSKRKLDPSKIDFIFITHRHLDHCADLNTIIEARTEGGFKSGCNLIIPKDGIDKDPVVLKYLRPFLENIETMEEKKIYKISDDWYVETPKKLRHSVECFGLNFFHNKRKILSFISDTEYFDELTEYYNGENVIMNVVLFKKTDLKHLSFEDIPYFIRNYRPKRLIITHFGMGMLKHKPWELAEKFSKENNINLIAARDGMEIDLNGKS